MQERLLKVRDAARAYACSPDTIRKLIRDGDLPAVHVGSSLRIRESDLDNYATPAVFKAEIASGVERGLADLRAQLDQKIAHLDQQVRELRHEVFPRVAR